MELFVKIEKGRYVDSLETLFSSTVFNEQPGIETGNIGMATDAFKDVNKELGLLPPEIAALSELLFQKKQTYFLPFVEQMYLHLTIRT